MPKIIKFLKKLVGRSEPEIQPDFEVYQAENRLENLEYSGTIEENVLKCIRDKPFRQRRLSSCAPTVRSIQEFGNMEEMCEKLGEEPDSSIDQISKNQRNNYKRRLSRRYSRKMSITCVPQNLNNNNNNNNPTSTSSSSLQQSLAGSNQNLQNIYKVPSNLDNTTRQSSTNRISQKASTSSRISGIQNNNRVSQNHNKLNSSTTAFNNNISNSNSLRKGSIFQNRRISIYSIDSIAGAGNQFLLQNSLNHTNENNIQSSVGHNNINNNSISNQKVQNSQNSSTNNNNSNTIGKSVSRTSNTNRTLIENLVETEDEEDDSFPVSIHQNRHSMSKRRSSNACKVYQKRNSMSNQHIPGSLKMLEGETPFDNQII